MNSLEEHTGSFRTLRGRPFITAETLGVVRSRVAQEEDGGNEVENIKGTGAAGASVSTRAGSLW